MQQRIEIIASAITKDEQLEVARLLIKVCAETTLPFRAIAQRFN